MRKVLLISPYFPPMSIIGAKRPLHLCRNLPAQGWQPVVLCADPSREPNDPELLAAVPPETTVSRGYHSPLRRRGVAAGSPEPLSKKAEKRRAERSRFPSAPRLQFISPFDRYHPDHRAAVRAGLKLAAEHGCELIHLNADPWAGLLVAAEVAIRSGLPLISDLRDPCSVNEAKMAVRPAPTQAAFRAMEGFAFRRSARVIVNTEATWSAYVAAYAGILPPSHFRVVRNAFDSGLFAGGAADGPAAEGPFRLLYFGTFRHFVDPEPLLAGMRRFVDARGLDPSALRLEIIGTLRDTDREAITKAGLGDFVEARPPVAYARALPVLRSAHALVLVADGTRKLQIPGKLYDYLAARRPILGVSANREANRIIDEAGAGRWAAPEDAEAVAEALGDLYERRARGELGDLSEAAVAPYSAAEQARKVAAVYEEALSSR